VSAPAPAPGPGPVPAPGPAPGHAPAPAPAPAPGSGSGSALAACCYASLLCSQQHRPVASSSPGATDQRQATDGLLPLLLHSGTKETDRVYRLD